MCECKKSMTAKTVCGCQSGRTPTFLRPVILLLLSKAPSHGYELMENIKKEKLLQKKPDTGAVYRMLRSLEREGFVVSRWGEKNTGPRKRVYTLNAKGFKLLKDWSNNIRTNRDSLARFLNRYDQRSK